MYHDRVTRWRQPTVVAAVAATLLVAGFGGDATADGAAATGGGALTAAGSTSTTSEPLGVVAEFYPLEFVVERVGGGLIDVSNLTPPGVEPHDMELTPQSTAALENADLVVYLAGFAPPVDETVAQLAEDQVFDVSPAARLDIEGVEHEDEHADETLAEDEHADDGGSVVEDDHGHGGVDPHFWLDPIRLADVADAVAARLGELAPDAAAEFTANAATLRTELEDLDGEYETGLASCASTELVTSHVAFAYLADRYGMTQVGITGLSPEDEPSPAELAEITHFVQDHDVSTVYTETLVDPALAETIAAETGASTAVLDPIEGLTDESAGSDYFEVMRSNLETLQAGQHCT
jgi:zinc transport system substrate-binding protein